jgi:hypothetical protein
MSTGLIPVDFTKLPAATGPGIDDEVFAEMSKGSDFLSRLQLAGKGKFVDTGKIKPGHYGIPQSGGEIIDLGNRIDLIALAWRPKVIDMSDDPIFVSFNVEDPRFQEVRELADVKDSKCQYGPSFLVLERKSQQFLELFLGTKSFRPEAKKIAPYLPVTQDEIDAKNATRAAKGLDPVDDTPHGPIPFTLTSQYIERAFSWWVPVVLECSSPFTNFPSAEAFNKELTRFRDLETKDAPSADSEATKKPTRKR